MQKEPLLTVATITAIAAALLKLAVAFGLTLTDGQTEAINTVMLLAAPFVVALVARAKVSPSGKLRAPLPPSASE